MSFSFLFPGQGSQYSGMFKNHFEEFPEFNEVIGAGEEFYKEDLRNIIQFPKMKLHKIRVIY